MRSRSSRRTLIALLLLACLAAPGAQAVGVGLHLALDVHHDAAHRSHEHGHDDGDGDRPSAPAVRGHSHRHELTAPSEGPLGVRPDAGGSAPDGPLSAGVGVATDVALLTGQASVEPEANRRRGSPVPLFYVHCSLLR